MPNCEWLRKTVGVVAAKDLPDAPSEEEFRLGLRNGLMLCNALNKVHPGAVPKVVVNPGDSVILPDGAALSAYQYFENVRNYLVAGQDLGLPVFEASDLEQVLKHSLRTTRAGMEFMQMKYYEEFSNLGQHLYSLAHAASNYSKVLMENRKLYNQVQDLRVA
ncbi:uncharacterized protein A4U43_C04F15740 [Asparagus officinalis]|uniref:Calponin-homology (CH) domain-containing protein n=1 Tax=Asparagus officinalis TaxID=4686 RepID=A0A5P1F2Y8_ASPOF|nr:kinesin-like protein KIN-14F [Asparagus officinalis]ONK72103.1 uncharacterized protein A4U43_C04F15740 [Asparagus officinalis]